MLALRISSLLAVVHEVRANSGLTRRQGTVLEGKTVWEDSGLTVRKGMLSEVNSSWGVREDSGLTVRKGMLSEAEQPKDCTVKFFQHCHKDNGKIISYDIKENEINEDRTDIVEEFVNKMSGLEIEGNCQVILTNEQKQTKTFIGENNFNDLCAIDKEEFKDQFKHYNDKITKVEIIIPNEKSIELYATNPITKVTVTRDNLEAGKMSTVTIKITMTREISCDGEISVTFPSGFDVSKVHLSDDSSSKLSVTGSVVTLVTDAQAGGQIELSLGGIKNPTEDQTGTFQIETTYAKEVFSANSVTIYQGPHRPACNSAVKKPAAKKKRFLSK